MENCAPPLPDAELEETITSTAAPFSTADETSRFRSTFEDCLSSLDANSPSDRSGARSSPEPKCEYFSARVELMMQTEDQFPSDVAHEIAHSKVHWSQVTHRSDLSDDDTDFDSEPVDLEYEGEVNRENELVFAELLNDPQWNHHQWGSFFCQWPSYLRLGRKIAEGGQAEIFELVWSNGDVDAIGLAKVFKRGHRLSDLRRQWPHGILRRDAASITGNATMLDDGRFAFVMGKCWGDLRKLIDQAMRLRAQRSNRGPPFPHHWNGKTWEARELLWRIASHMKLLHSQGILHRDLKAANILLSTHEYIPTIMVADFECSIGVTGTTFWRAPEILAAVRNRTAIEFSEKADTYSYGMTCFEVVTGRLPFEGELEICRASYNLVIEGRRPKLPRDVDEVLKALMERCWDPIPSGRPTFLEICEILDNGYKE